MKEQFTVIHLYQLLKTTVIICKISITRKLINQFTGCYRQKRVVKPTSTFAIYTFAAHEN